MSKHFIGSLGKYTRKKSHDLMLWEGSNNSNDTFRVKPRVNPKWQDVRSWSSDLWQTQLSFTDTLWKKAKEKIPTKHQYVLAACIKGQSTQNINTLSSFILLHVISNLYDCLSFVEQKKNSEQSSGGCFLFNYNKQGLKLQEGQEITLKVS